MVGGQNFFHSQEKEKEWVYVMIGVRQTECPASHVRTWWCDLVWHCTILWSVISLCGKYNVTFCLVVFLIKFNRFYNCLASDLTLFQGRSRTRHLKLHVVFLVRFLSNILMSSLQEECKPWQCLCVWHLMNLLGFMVCVPVHCYELVIGFECSISSTCLPQENTDRVQREWACTECRGSGHVLTVRLDTKCGGVLPCPRSFSRTPKVWKSTLLHYSVLNAVFCFVLTVALLDSEFFFCV